MKSMKPFSDEENKQFNEIEGGLNESIKRNGLVVKFLMTYAAFTIASLFNSVSSSLDLNLSLFKLIVTTVFCAAGLVILSFTASRIEVISGDNFIARFFSNHNFLSVIIFMSAACGGLAMGAAIRQMYYHGFSMLACAYVVLNSLILVGAIYMYKLIIPAAIFTQEA